MSMGKHTSVNNLWPQSRVSGPIKSLNPVCKGKEDYPAYAHWLMTYN